MGKNPLAPLWKEYANLSKESKMLSFVLLLVLSGIALFIADFREQFRGTLRGEEESELYAQGDNASCTATEIARKCIENGAVAEAMWGPDSHISADCGNNIPPFTECRLVREDYIYGNNYLTCFTEGFSNEWNIAVHSLAYKVEATRFHFLHKLIRLAASEPKSFMIYFSDSHRFRGSKDPRPIPTLPMVKITDLDDAKVSTTGQGVDCWNTGVGIFQNAISKE